MRPKDGEKRGRQAKSKVGAVFEGSFYQGQKKRKEEGRKRRNRRSSLAKKESGDRLGRWGKRDYWGHRSTKEMVGKNLEDS